MGPQKLELCKLSYSVVNQIFEGRAGETYPVAGFTPELNGSVATRAYKRDELSHCTIYWTKPTDIDNWTLVWGNEIKETIFLEIPNDDLTVVPYSA